MRYKKATTALLSESRALALSLDFKLARTLDIRLVLTELMFMSYHPAA